MMNTTLTSSTPVARPVSVAWSNVALGALVLLALAVHAYNMFGYPLYLGDEGIYMSQAYAVLKLNALTPYAYWYDHAPAGWLLIAAWSAITGGFHTFGTAIDGGRVLMLLLHIVSLALLFQIALRLTRSAYAAAAAGLLWTLSPLAVLYGRMVLLDNIMVFWALLATLLVLQHSGKIWPLLWSGLCFGIAVLTKENALLLLPAFVYGMWTLVDDNHARFARAGWLFLGISTISLYVLYAALREELIALPITSPLAGGAGPVSLVGTLLWQLGRGGSAPWSPSSDFVRALTQAWLPKDAWLPGLGLVATLWNVFQREPGRRLIGLLGLLACLSIARGAVLDFYIVAALPFLALNVGLALESLAERSGTAGLLPLAIIAAVAIGWSNLGRQPDMFNLKLTAIQRQALAWVQAHVPPQAQIVADDDLWVDLRNGAPGQPSFPGVHSHWKVADDPAVHKGLFDDNWHNIDYLILTPGLDNIFEQNKTKLPYAAYSRSTPVARFSVGDAAVEIRRVDNAGIATTEMLEHTYRSFRDQFVKDGQVRDAGGYTDARDQASAMLMAVWMNDKSTFDELWGWAHLHLQNQNSLLYTTNRPGAAPKTATDADTDAALALLLAERRWNDASYGRQGREMVQSIWEYEVVDINGAPYLAAGDWAVGDDQVIFAPSAFVPYAYHLFAAADPGHNWWYLLSNSYQVLADVSSAPLGAERSAGLPPAYVGIDRTTGEFRANPQGAPAGSAFDATAAQVYWRVGLDAQWHDDGRADSFLTASRFLRDEWRARGGFVSSYAHDGTPQGQAESLLLESAVLPRLMADDPGAGHALYATKLATAFDQSKNEGQWGNGDDIAQQRWLWLATGLYDNALNYQWPTK
jgi:endo-1,4-beta-D-glucanase Y/4-amino-4-deoxy-L-arabinose transferase-like glycosyltransferase